MKSWAIANIELILWASGALSMAFVGLAGYIGRDIYRRVYGQGLVTDDHCKQCEAAQHAAHKIVDKRLEAGDRLFREIKSGQRTIALVLYQLCKALNEHLNLRLDCEQLAEHITGRPDHEPD
jgi:hypothetical protein